MDGTCDRCIAHTRTWWWRTEDRLELQLCGHHGTQHAPALTAQRFTLARDERPVLVPALRPASPGQVHGRVVR